MQSHGRLRGAYAAVVAGTLAAAPARALDPGKLLTQYVRTSWQTEQGLPQNNVETMLQTRDGYLWLGTQAGLVRFDGVRFVTFDKRSTPALGHNWVNALAEDRDGTLWIGTLGGGLARLSGGEFSSLTAKDGLGSNQIYSLAADRDGSLWIGTLGAGVHHLASGRVTTYGKKEGLPTDNVLSLLQDKAGDVWAGGDGGLGRIRGGKVTTLGAAEGLPPGRVRALGEDSDGNVWIGIGEGAVCRLKDGRILAGEIATGSFGRLRSMRRDRDGNLWIGTAGRGLARFADGRLAFLTSKEGLPSEDVASLLEDREGTLWVGLLRGGLVRMRDGRVTPIGTPEGLSSDNVRALCEDAQGALWLATERGLNRWQDGRATVYTTADGLTHDVIQSLVESPAGRLLVGLRGEGLDAFEGGRGKSLEKARLTSGQVTSIVPGRDGSLWLATSGGGVNRLRDGELTSITRKDGLSSDIVISLLEDRTGTLFMGTMGGGLCSLDALGVSCRTMKDGLGSDIVTGLHEDQAGTLWIATAGGGLNRLKDGRLTSCAFKDGLPDDTLYSILEDGRGRLWMSANAGIIHVEKSRVEAFLDGAAPSVEAVLYDTGDGMRSAEGNGGTQPSGFKARDGRLWFATVRGAVSVDPERVEPNRLAPPVVLEELVADGRLLRPRDGLRLAAGTRRLEARYTALALRTPEKVRFRYRLEGFDPDWVEAGTKRLATYTNLPPGSYTLRVKAANEDGVWSETGASVAVVLEPFFHQTWWFAGLCAALVLAGGYGGFRLRVRRLERRQRELLELVEERTADLRRAQEQIDRLSSSAVDVLEDPAGWAGTIAAEVARAIGAREIGVYVLEDDRLVPLASGATRPPSAERLREARESGVMAADAEGETIVPVLSMTGDPRGALVVDAPGVELREVERRLLSGFAHHLGMALDLRQLRTKLTAAEANRAASLKELRQRGIRTLQVCPACGACYDDDARACAADSGKLDDSRVLPFRIAGRYRLERLLGEGGMGSVFAARDERLERTVALKVIRREHLLDLNARLRFEREARTVARIHHPGVIALHDTGELEDGSAFLVMELLHGSTLGSVLERFGPGSPAQVASLLRQTGSGLAAAHALPVIHRDVKPDNIFLASAPGGFTVKLLDFGLAKTVRTDARLTRTGIIVGTPAYMSPEQVQGLPLDERSDLYSLAAVAYEALTGRSATAGATDASILMEVLTGKPPRVSELLAGVPVELDVAFARAFAKLPEKRPPSVEAWVKVVAPLLEALPAGVGKGSWPAELSAEGAPQALGRDDPETRVIA